MHYTDKNAKCYNWYWIIMVGLAPEFWVEAQIMMRLHDINVRATLIFTETLRVFDGSGVNESHQGSEEAKKLSWRGLPFGSVATLGIVILHLVLR